MRRRDLLLRLPCTLHTEDGRMVQHHSQTRQEQEMIGRRDGYLPKGNGTNTQGTHQCRIMCRKFKGAAANSDPASSKRAQTSRDGDGENKNQESGGENIVFRCTADASQRGPDFETSSLPISHSSLFLSHKRDALCQLQTCP